MSFHEDGKTAYAGETFSRLTLAGETVEGREYDKCTFSKCSLLQCKFLRCTFIDCVWEECMLSAVAVDGTSFRECAFRECKMMGLNWNRAAAVRGLLCKGSQLIGCNFSTLKISGIALCDCTVRDTAFTGADCSHADFRGTDFTQSIFSGTNLTGADFRNAYQYAIDFRSNTLKKTKFSLPEATTLLSSLDIILE
jgi:fluoroquinolone resistance protein